MIIAQKPATGPFLLTIMGGAFTFAPITRPMLMRARRWASSGATSAGAASDDSAFLDDVGNAVSLALLTEGLIGWEHGAAALPVGDDEDVGDAEIVEVDGLRYRILPFSPENKALLLSDAVIFDAFDTAYVLPFVMRERAKNVPAGSSDGISSRVTPAKDTAAPRAAAKSGAKRARTGNTRSRTKKSS
ncbi:hypothetical protein [Sphingomonas dokdonensis]|uniref:Uncharacterized protein n=1 Tax=Sphingomonas dokdonensis TaxID=344880 RepID=A0A245ZHK3_9SPHN|nr:hypothetical protein [Sphingomonas dokdonensis]OWK29210.1 hypothetical protein SPDO_21910 [Sphingomonas dokdonensis]